MIIVVVVAVAVAVWLFAGGGEPLPETTETGFTDLPPPRGDVPMPDTALAVPAQESSGQPNSYATEVRFPDGDRIEIRWWERTELPIDLSGSIATDYVPLRLAAEAGDGQAAWLLYEGLRSCEVNFRSERELSDALEQLQQTRSITMPNGSEMGFSPNMSDEDISRVVAALRQGYVDCIGVADWQISEKDKVLKMAAEGGSSEAAIEYARELEELQLARRWLDSAWEQGNARALNFLAENYRESYERGLEADGAIKAYAAGLLHAALTESEFSDRGMPTNSIVSDMRDYLEYTAARMRPHEVDEAMEMAKAMLRSNPNCCERAY